MDDDGCRVIWFPVVGEDVTGTEELDAIGIGVSIDVGADVGLPIIGARDDG